MQYGTHCVDYNGCELIAVYNALFQLGDRHALAGIIYDARTTGGVSWGPGAVWGSHPDQLASLLTQYGHNYTFTEDRSAFNGMLSVGSTYIVSFWNEGFAKGLHTVMFNMVADNKIEVYNYYTDSSSVTTFYASGDQSALDVMLNQNGSEIILYKVE